MSEMPSAEGYHAMEDSGITYSSPEYHSLYFLQCIVFLPASWSWGRPDPWLGLTVPGIGPVFLAGSSAKASGIKLLIHTHFTPQYLTQNPKF